MSFCQNPDPGSLLTSPRSMLIGGSAALALLLAPSLTEAQTPAPGVPPGERHGAGAKRDHHPAAEPRSTG